MGRSRGALGCSGGSGDALGGLLDDSKSPLGGSLTYHGARTSILPCPKVDFALSEGRFSTLQSSILDSMNRFSSHGSLARLPRAFKSSSLQKRKPRTHRPALNQRPSNDRPTDDRPTDKPTEQANDRPTNRPSPNRPASPPTLNHRSSDPATNLLLIIDRGHLEALKSAKWVGGMRGAIE